MITASDDSSAVLWDQRTSQAIATLPHGGKVRWAAYSNNGQTVVTACEDAAVRVWDTSRVNVLPHLGYVTTNCWSASGSLVATVANENLRPRVCIWDTSTGLLVANHEFEEEIESCSFGANASNMTIRLRPSGTSDWDLIGTKAPALEASGSSQSRFPLPSKKYKVEASKRNKKVALLSYLQDSKDSESLCGLLHRQDIRYCVLSPDDRYLLATCADGTARLWNLADVATEQLQHKARWLVASSDTESSKVGTRRRSERAAVEQR
jgi:WD40 repeat protein